MTDCVLRQTRTFRTEKKEGKAKTHLHKVDKNEVHICPFYLKCFNDIYRILLLLLHIKQEEEEAEKGKEM